MKVAVIQGGPSTEAEVSRRSAKGVHEALIAAGHDAIRVELDSYLPEVLWSERFDVAFPVTHGRLGEDGSLQGLLEILNIPYVGSDVLATAVAYNKVVAKRAFVAAGLCVADEVVVRHGEALDEAACRVRAVLGRSVVVKPASEGSALGVTRVNETDEDFVVVEALERALSFGGLALCETFLHGREITCAVLELSEHGGFRALPVTEIFSKAASWYDFQSRYASGGSVHVCPADLAPDIAKRVQEMACAAHRALGCRDLCRADFVVDPDAGARAVTVLEVNTLPGMTPTSLYPEACLAAGIRFDALCDALVRNAQVRGRSAKRVRAEPLPL